MQHKIVRWEDPEQKQLGRPPAETGTWVEVAEALRRRPKQWAVVSEGVSARALVTAINQGTCIDFRPIGDFEATSRTVRGARVVYARYMGD
jgi:hypothetical protein